MEEKENVYSMAYEYDNKLFNVEASREMHDRLSNDVDYFVKKIVQNQSCGMGAGKEVQGQETVPQENTANSTLPSKQTWKWTNASTMLLINRYKEKREDFRNPKIKKRELWTWIKQEFEKHGYVVTEDELDRKWRNMKKTYTGILDNKRATGGGRIYWEHFNAFDEIYATDRSLNLPTTISSFPSPRTQQVNATMTSQSTNQASRHIIPPTVSPGALSLDDAPGPSSTALQGNSATTPSRGGEERMQKRLRNRNLYAIRKQTIDLEEKRLQELILIRKAIEANNKIAQERNDLLKKLQEQGQ